MSLEKALFSLVCHLLNFLLNVIFPFEKNVFDQCVQYSYACLHCRICPAFIVELESVNKVVSCSFPGSYSTFKEMVTEKRWQAEPPHFEINVAHFILCHHFLVNCFSLGDWKNLWLPFFCS